MTAAEKEEKSLRAIIGASYVTAILANAQGVYRLIDLSNVQQLPQEEFVGFRLLGVIAFHSENGGGVRIALDEELPQEVISALSLQFLKQLEQELNSRVIAKVAKQIGDTVDWLQRLHTLPDLRGGMEN